MSNYTILVVDDEANNLQLIKSVLKADYEIITAADGQEAKEILEKETPAIIISDITMPRMDGYELIAWVKTQARLKYTKILLLSGLGQVSDKLKGYEMGADDYIQKPYKPLELSAKVNIFAKLKQTEDELRNLTGSLEKQVVLRTNQLLESEKLAVLGRNISGLIHSLNNPLCAILGISSLLELKHPTEPSLPILKNATKKMQDIVSNILLSTRSKNTLEKSKINLIDIIKAELEISNSGRFSNGVTFKTDYQPLSPINGVASDFSQIFGNLIDNSLQSMHERKNKVLSISTKQENNENIITIEDTGCGIPQENLERIFDPFFTTKPITSDNKQPTGTGLGMPTCKTMLEAYGGKMLIDSEVNVGTIMRIFVPITKTNESIEQTA